MKKYRWATVSFPFAIDELARRMKRVKFNPNEDDSQGFRIQGLSNDSLHAIFIEKEVVYDQIIIPTGDEYEERRSKINITEFSINSSDRHNLLLINPPRRSTPFHNALSEISDNNFFSEAPDANILDWINNLQGKVENIKINYIDCNAIQLSQSISARFAFRGEEDVRMAMKKAIRNAPFTVESVKCDVYIHGIRTSLELLRNGTAKLDQDKSSLLLPLILESLPVPQR